MSHAAQARRLLTDASGAVPADWSVVLCFYASLHAISHGLWGGNLAPHGTTHMDRLQALHASPQFKGLCGDYKSLKKASEKVRYEPWQITVDPALIATCIQKAGAILKACNVP